MNLLTIGDLAQTFQIRRQNHALKSDLNRLSQELAIGRHSDLGRATRGDLSVFNGLEHDLKLTDSYSVATTEAGVLASSIQSALEQVETTASDLGPALLSASSSQHATLILATASDAREKLASVLGALNLRVADRYALSGTASSTPPLPDAATFLASVQTATAGQTTAAGISATLDAWFDTPGGGFETTTYQGAGPIAPFQLSETTTISLKVTASDFRIRNTLKGLAMAALVGSGALAGNEEERTELARLAGVTLLDGASGMAGLRAEVGTAEASIDQARAHNFARASALEIARNDIVGIDPFRTATDLENVRAQLDILYRVTSRLSKLSLAAYL